MKMSKASVSGVSYFERRESGRWTFFGLRLPVCPRNKTAVSYSCSLNTGVGKYQKTVSTVNFCSGRRCFAVLSVAYNQIHAHISQLVLTNPYRDKLNEQEKNCKPEDIDGPFTGTLIPSRCVLEHYGD